MPVTITPLDELKESHKHVVSESGVESVIARSGDRIVQVDRFTGGAITPKTVLDGSIYDFLTESGWTLADVLTEAPDGSTSVSLPDKHHKRWSKIFRYFFRYPSAQRQLVHSFCAAVRDDWSSTVRDRGVPSAWDEQQADSGEYLLEYDARMAHAVQYGREEPIAQQVDDFAQVDFAKIMSPAIDWGGMTLTDPTDGTKKTFAPGELHLTDDDSLRDQTATKVTRLDLIAHWGLSFS